MTERFAGRSGDSDAPALHGFAITPDNSADLTAETRAIYVGSSGDLAVILAGGEEVTFVAVAAGSLLPLRLTRVKATGTTAGDLVGLY